MSSSSLVRAQCTQAERNRMDIWMFDEATNVLTVDHPKRFHNRLVRDNAEHHGHVELESIDLGDGWVRVAYALNMPGSKR